MAKHALVWIDHKEAKIYRLDSEVDPTTIKPSHHFKLTTTAEHAHPADEHHFFRAIEEALGDVEEILITGPGGAKLELVKYAHKSDAGFERRIVGVETVDHPTDGELVAHGHKFFHGKDRLLGTVP
jgi:stalled ribosome rescue protein Dom34